VTGPATPIDRELNRWTIQSSFSVRYEVEETPDLLNPNNPKLRVPPLGDGTDSGTRLVVLDHSIDALYGPRIRRYFSMNGADVDYLALPCAEEFKSIDPVLKIVTRLNEIGTYRLSNPPIAIGGGVLTDVVGLATSLYRRGIPYVRVPTTLLSQIDVSVAAKTGINFGGYRNRIGTYSPAAKTLIDRSFLATLPDRHLRNGMGEVLKMALISSARLFDLLDEFGAELVESRFQAGETAAEVIALAVGGMAMELEPNLWEKDLCRAVDYGHSFSPLVEMRALPDLLHGEAVALDCVFSAILAARRRLIQESTLDRIVAVTRRLGLPVVHDLFLDTDLLAEALADCVRHRNGNQNLPLLTEIGRVRFVNDLTRNEIAAAVDVMKTYR
jgi:3-dehydroquinate synthetase